MHDERVSNCGKWFFAATHESGEVTRFISAPVRCHSWNCPICRKAKAAAYRKRMDRLDTLPRLWFYTLTYYHSVSPDEAWSTYNKAWNRLRTSITKLKGRFNYVRILESHKKSDYPHLHVIADVGLGAVEFGRLAIKAGFGYQIRSAPITGDGAKRYVTKYVTKEWTNDTAARLRERHHCRIISFSRGLLSSKKKQDGWRMLLLRGSWQECVDALDVAVNWTNIRKEVDIFREIDNRYVELHVKYDESTVPVNQCICQDFTPDWYIGKGRGPDYPCYSLKLPDTWG
jgi:hypothetical protein